MTRAMNGADEIDAYLFFSNSLCVALKVGKSEELIKRVDCSIDSREGLRKLYWTRIGGSSLFDSHFEIRINKPRGFLIRIQTQTTSFGKTTSFQNGFFWSRSKKENMERKLRHPSSQFASSRCLDPKPRPDGKMCTCQSRERELEWSSFWSDVGEDVTKRNPNTKHSCSMTSIGQTCIIQQTRRARGWINFTIWCNTPAQGHPSWVFPSKVHSKWEGGKPF